MSKNNSQRIKPYSYADNFIDKLSMEDRCCLELVYEHYKKAELEGEPDRPVTFTQEQVDARAAKKETAKKVRLKSHRFFMKTLSAEDAKNR